MATRSLAGNGVVLRYGAYDSDNHTKQGEEAMRQRENALGPA